MKTMLLFSFVFLLGCTVFAQSIDAPNSPYATYSYEKMKPDNVPAGPWDIKAPDMPPQDGIPALPRPIRIINSADGNACKPNSPVVKYVAAPMEPDGINPNRIYPVMRKMLPR
jgi:hypothetical protein